MRRRRGFRLGQDEAGQDEAGQVTVLIIGCVLVLALALALVVNASAAYLQRQNLNSVADGAALHGVDRGVAGTYAGGLEGRLAVDEDLVRGAVRSYLLNAGAHGRYPGLSHRVEIGPGGDVTVVVQAPLELPLRLPGTPRRALVSASARAAVTVVG